MSDRRFPVGRKAIEQAILDTIMHGRRTIVSSADPSSIQSADTHELCRRAGEAFIMGSQLTAMSLGLTLEEWFAINDRSMIQLRQEYKRAKDELEVYEALVASWNKQRQAMPGVQRRLEELRGSVAAHEKVLGVGENQTQ